MPIENAALAFLGATFFRRFKTKALLA